MSPQPAPINPYKYQPRKHFIPMHNRTQRYGCIVCHRRSGKTVGLVNDLIIGAMETPLHRPQFAYIAPTYVMAKRIAWDYVKDYGGPLQPKGARPNESELRIDLINAHGSTARVFLAGADNPDSLRGIYLDGAVVDEDALIAPYVSTQIIMPALSDRRGWLVKAGTPKGKNHFHNTYTAALADPKNWYTMFLPASLSGIIPADELAQLKKSMGADEYEQEMECSFTATSKGQILFREVMAARAEKRIGTHIRPVSPALSPVIASSDIGFRDTAAFWLWQIVPGGFLLIGYIAHSGLDAQDWIDLLRKLPQPPSTVYLPHDGGASHFVMKHSAEEQFRAFPGWRVHVVPKTSILDRINAARTIMPWCSFAEGEPGVALGLHALEEWQYQWNPDTQVFSQAPLHNHASNGSDSFSYGAQVLGYHIDEARRMRVKAGPRDVIPEGQGANYTFSLEQLHQDAAPSGRIDGF